MNCPNCSVHLTVAERHGIEIDHCSQCRGVWLDRGELDKIIERASRGDLPGRRDGRRLDDDDESRDDDRRSRKKREGFLGELFDF